MIDALPFPPDRLLRHLFKSEHFKDHPEGRLHNNSWQKLPGTFPNAGPGLKKHNPI